MIIISDFSKTFTSSDMPTTWSVFAKSGILWDDYVHDRVSLYNEYSHLENQGNVDKTEEWFLKHTELFVKYHLTQEQIDTLVMNDEYFAPRAGVSEFLEEIEQLEIPLYIVSSGITQIIARWFELRYDYIPDIIIANDLIINDWVVTWVDYDSVICPLDKEIELEFDHHDKAIILIWDNIEDTKIIKNPTKTIGFTDEERGFDIKLWWGASMIDVLEYIS